MIERVIKEIEVFQTSDGKQFGTETEAWEHQNEINKTPDQKAVENFCNTWSGKRLLEEHTLDETGDWEVRGEDPNFDLGGHHHNPLLGNVRGTLRQAIIWGSQQSGWGYGGEIKPLRKIIVL